jgi:hypothetical protein
MNVVVVFAILAVVLFVGAYISKRRFGLLGLALAAGSILSTIWNYDAGLIVSAIGIIPEGPVTTAVTLSLIVVLPAILLLFHGYTYKHIIGRLVGAFLFTVLTLAFLVEPLGYVFTVEGSGSEAYMWLLNNKDVIISIGMIIAVVDLFFTKPAHLAEKRGRH